MAGPTKPVANGTGGGGSSGVIVLDEGTPLGIFTSINFIGVDVLAKAGVPNTVNVYIPPPSYLSHWNTSDGANGSQLVTDTISSTLARIVTPSGGAGSPFYAGTDWSGSNRLASLTGAFTATSPSATTGWGGDSTVKVIIYSIRGPTVGEQITIHSFTTPAITGDVVLNSPGGYVTVNVSGFGPDSLRYQAKLLVTVNTANLFTALGQEGGRYKVSITHTVDSVTDDGSEYLYETTPVFLDTNANTPSAGDGTHLPAIAETAGSILTKHISGLEYYRSGSQFTISLSPISNLNRNTAKVSANLIFIGTEFGLPTLSHSPFGTGSAFFSNYDSVENDIDTSYLNSAWAITAANYRYAGPSGNVSAHADDTWNTGATNNSINHSILIDTYTDNATVQFQDFNGEARRRNSSFSTAWDSNASLLVNEAAVFNGRLMAIDAMHYIRSDGPQSVNTNWSGYKPDLNGANPDYTALTGLPARSYWLFGDLLLGVSRASMQIIFAGTPAGANFLADLVSGALEIYVYRVGGLGHTGPPPGNTTPLLLHGASYNNATFDDGVTDGHIRETSSVNNTINATFGGLPVQDGFYCTIVINNAAIKIDTMTVSYF